MVFHCLSLVCRAEDELEDVEPPKADADLGSSREAVRTDAEAVQR